MSQALFTAISAELTGFSEFELQATGVVEVYYKKLVATNPDHFGELLSAFADSMSIEDILADVRLGPVARNIIKMWYTGSLDGNPVSGEAYVEGLVWRALDAHPMGARPQGYGTWSQPPGTWPNVSETLD